MLFVEVLYKTAVQSFAICRVLVWVNNRIILELKGVKNVRC